mgnify:CR=1 FL=1
MRCMSEAFLLTNGSNNGQPGCTRICKRWDGSRSEYCRLRSSTRPGRISEIGHTLIPQLWLGDRRLRHDVSEKNQHLDTLQEVWWLSRWHGIAESSVHREYLMHRSGKNRSTVDWRFDIRGAGIAINLSIKNRKGTAVSEIYKKRLNLFDSKDGSPFEPSGPDEINVLAITAYHGGILTENEQRMLVMDFLKKNDSIDAVAIWIRVSFGQPSPGALDGGMHLFFPDHRPLDRKDQILRVLCKQEIDIEDSAAVGILRHAVELADIVDMQRQPQRLITS